MPSQNWMFWFGLIIYLDRMVELAARHRFDMEGNSISGSDDDLNEESEYDGESAMPTPSASGGGPRKKRSRDHRGVKFEDMKRIFEVLVRTYCNRRGRIIPHSYDIIVTVDTAA
jgi:hypothetical protein